MKIQAFFYGDSLAFIESSLGVKAKVRIPTSHRFGTFTIDFFPYSSAIVDPAKMKVLFQSGIIPNSAMSYERVDHELADSGLAVVQSWPETLGAPKGGEATLADDKPTEQTWLNRNLVTDYAW